MKFNSKFQITTKFWRFFASLFRFKTLPLANWVFKKTEDGDYIEIPLFGFRMPMNVARSVMHRCLCLEGERFIPEKDILFKILRRSITCIDVGANIGYYLLLLQKAIGLEGQIFCIEPEPQDLEELKKCVQINQFKNVSIIEAAIGEKDSKEELRFGINALICVGDKGDLTVEIKTLDSFIFAKPDFIKIDVEGYEGKVLLGARNLLKNFRPTLFIEIHPQALPKYGISFKEILLLSKDYYTNINCFQLRSSKSLLEKIAIRYSFARAIERINSSGLLEKCERNLRQDTFWMVCSN